VIKFSLKLIQSTLQALKSLRKDRPQVILGFGGFGSVPVVLSAALLSIPRIQNLVQQFFPDQNEMSP